MPRRISIQSIFTSFLDKFSHMKSFLVMTLCLMATVYLNGQLTTPVYGGNKKAWSGERVGLTDVTIHYDRPAVKGRDGKIWGGLVKEGFFAPDFGSNKTTPWRAGANENTTISFSNDVKIEGKPLAAGTYGLFIAYKPDASTIIFSKNSSSWGSYFYNEKEDALRVNVKPIAADRSVEWLKYEFTDETDSTAVVKLSWEKLSIPFTIQVDLIKDQLASFRKELRGEKGFNWQAFDQAAQWCANNQTNINEALMWSDSATSPIFGGDAQYRPWATKSQLLRLAGKNDEADKTMKKALSVGSVTDIHQYGRQLLSENKPKEALEIFKLNAQKYPDEFTALMGLVRGYSANNEFRTAIKYAKEALPLAPDQANKVNVESSIEKLKNGKDIN